MVRLLAALLVCISFCKPATAAEALKLDFAYYNPISLVVRQQHLVEQAVGPGVEVTWTQSAGSNKALEYLRGSVLDFGSTAGSAALLGRANGVPIKIISVYGRMEWVALVTKADSPIHSVGDLRGKRVAATPGTDAGIFLLRALQAAHVTKDQLTLVPLQHKDGRAALDRGDVDAWSGLDPFMALAQTQSNDRLFYRNTAFVTPGTLVVREAYAQAHPDRVAQVLAAYETARVWALAHPDDFLKLIASQAKLQDDAARLQLARSHFGSPAVTPADRASIQAAAAILKSGNALSQGADIDRAAAELIDTSYVDRMKTARPLRSRG